MTASNVNYWADVANHVTLLWQAGDIENFERWITGWLWALSRSRAAQSQDKVKYRYNVVKFITMLHMVLQ